MWRPIGIIAGRLRQLTSVLAECLSFGVPTSLDAVTGSVTVTRSYHVVFSSAASGTTNLLTINGGSIGQQLVIGHSGARSVRLRDNDGNLRIAGDFTMDSDFDTITLMYTGTVWVELCRSNN